jgi:hypothetical protein
VKLFALLLVAAFLVSGCVASNPTSKSAPVAKKGLHGGVVSKLLESGPIPAGCGLDRHAVVHGFGQQMSDAPLAAGVGCINTTPWNSGEPSIGITSKGNVFLYPAMLSPVPNSPDHGQFVGGLGMARSTDQGGNWTRQFSMVGPVNWQSWTADPFMYVDPYTDRVFMEDLMVPPFNCSNLSYSDDEGQTWKQTVGGCLVWDHVSYGAGKPITAHGGYPDNVYRCAITYIMTTIISEASGCQKSLDGGQTWQPPGQPAFLGGPDGMPYVPTTCNGAHGHIFVDHRGWVWLPRGWCDNKPYVAVSKDEGATWERHRITDQTMAGHDAGIGVDANGVAYYFYLGRDNLPYLSISHDDGKTWSTPQNVAPPGVKATGSPNLSSGGAGKIAMGYAANIEGGPANGVHGVLTLGYGVDGDHPVFESVYANPTDKPVATGNCRGTCPGQADFLALKIGPDGTPWMSIMNNRFVGAIRLYGAPSLWDASDPNGPFKN